MDPRAEWWVQRLATAVLIVVFGFGLACLMVLAITSP